MIKVKTFNENGRYFVSMVGHANSAPKGEDLVCCAASTLFQTLVFYVSKQEEDGLVKINELELDEEVKLLVFRSSDRSILGAYEMFLDGINVLIENFPKNISLLG